MPRLRSNVALPAVQSPQVSFQIQSSMSDRNDAAAVLTAVLKKKSDTDASIVGNLR